MSRFLSNVMKTHTCSCELQPPAQIVRLSELNQLVSPIIGIIMYKCWSFGADRDGIKSMAIDIARSTTAGEFPQLAYVRKGKSTWEARYMQDGVVRDHPSPPCAFGGRGEPPCLPVPCGTDGPALELGRGPSLVA